jgi:ATPase subunit of ABC transporter with duplicated ATPase domains
VISQSLNKYQWAMIMVSHDEVFVNQLDYLEKVDLGKLIN